MIKTDNFLINLVDKKELLNIISRHEIALPYAPEKYIRETNDEFYQVSDSQGIGSKYLIRIDKLNFVALIMGVSFLAARKSEARELINGLKAIYPGLSEQKNKFVGRLHPSAFTPKLHNILIRNEKLSKMLASFNWLNSAKIIFKSESFTMKSKNPDFEQVFDFHKEIPPVLSEEKKSFFVEHEIYEQDLHSLRNLFVSLYRKSPGSVSNLVFTYTKAEGLK